MNGILAMNDKQGLTTWADKRHFTRDLCLYLP